MRCIKRIGLVALALLVMTGGVFAGGQKQGAKAPLDEIYKQVSNDGSEHVKPEDFKVGEVKPNMTVALICGTMGSGFFKALPNAAAAVFKKYGVKVIEFDARQNIATQVSQIEDALAQGVDGILINAVDPPSAVSIALNKAAAQGVPVVAVDSHLDANFHNYLGMIGSDNWKIGYVCGEYIAKEMIKRYGTVKGNLAILDGVQGNAVVVDVMDGFWTAVKEVDPNHQLKEITRLYGGSWTEEAGIQMAEDILVAHPQIDVMFGPSDPFVVGATAAANRVGRKEMIMVARDGSKTAMKIMYDGGPIKGLGKNDPIGIGQAGAMLMLSYLTTGYLPKNRLMMLEPYLVTPENVKDLYDPNADF